MPLLTHFHPGPGLHIGIWRCTEDADELASRLTLSSSDHQRYASIRNPSRKRQFLGCRAALATLPVPPQASIVYHPGGKPGLDRADAYISFSHTQEYAVVMLSYKGPVGIDIEVIKPRIERVAGRFLSSEEGMLIGKPNRVAGLTLCWTIKEAIFKINGHPSVDLQKDIGIESIDYLCCLKGDARAILRQQENSLPVTASFLHMADAMISWATIPDHTSG